MIRDQQVIKLKGDLKRGLSLAASAARAGMSEKTGRKDRPKRPAESTET
jgi:lambda repressor-like predicted transcriptional regulator